MSATLNTTNIKHASSGSNNIVLAADGSVSMPNSSFGKILQVVSTNVTSTSSVSFANAGLTDTPATVTITSAAANSKFLISGVINGEANQEDYKVGFVLRRVIAGSGASIAVGDSSGSRSSVTAMHAQGYTSSNQATTPSTSVIAPYFCLLYTSPSPRDRG